MSFDSSLKDVFDIDIWVLKSKYVTSVNSKALDTKIQLEIVQKDEVKTKAKKELLYTGNINSAKEVNFFIKSRLNLNFFKSVSNNLFFKSKVKIYETESIDKLEGNNENQLNFFEQDISSDDELLSIQNKKYILSKLYDYADFGSK